VRVDGSGRLDSAPRGLTARPMAAPQLQALAGSRNRDLGWPAPQEMLARVAILEQAAVFYTLPDPTLRVLARRMRPVTVAAGDTVLHQGEPGDSIFLLSSGRCRVVVERPAGHFVTVALLDEGDFFGDTACLLNRSQPAAVIAQTDCKLLSLDRQSVFGVLNRQGHALDELRRLADQRLRTYTDTAVQASWGMLLEEATIVGVYSPKGGSGGTCLALNLVGALSRRHPGQVLLLDLDFPYTHAALLAGLVPTTCLARTAAAPREAFEEVLLSAVLLHAGGPMILPGALKPEEADLVTPELVDRAVGVLRRTFRYVVVDLGVSMSDATLAVLDQTQHLVLIASADLSAVKSAADALTILEQLGTPPDRLTLVLNNRVPRPAVSKQALERMLGRSVDLEVPYDLDRPDRAAVDGEILSLTDPRSEITRAVGRLAEQLEATHVRTAARPQPAQPPPGER